MSSDGGPDLILTPFYYLRHGETDWNRAGLAQGRTDVPLNERGLAQAEAARPALSTCEIATICCSPLARARRTAEIVGRDIAAEIFVIDDLAECCWGDAEGQPKGKWFADWLGGVNQPNAESYASFMARALAGLNTALRHPGPVLIVGHGGVYWAVQQHGRLDADADIPNCLPVRHDPPVDGYPGWTTHLVGRRNGSG